MATILYSFVPEIFDTEWFDKKIDTLPLTWQQRILRYKQPQDRMLRLYGRLLLIKLLDHLNQNALLLSPLEYSPGNKPYLNSAFDFNIAHSGHIAICAGSTDCYLGVDIEEIIPLNFTLIREHFTPAEWVAANSQSDPARLLYHYWTRKEALLKASGKGVYGEFAKIETLESIIHFNESTYYLYPLNISSKYCGHIALTKPCNIDIQEVKLI